MTYNAQVTDYNELDEITHTIECPDVYMGALKNVNKELFTFDGKDIKLERVVYNTGLLKIFDEILTNATDNLQRKGSGIKNIVVSINKDDSISVYNDGKTIPIEKNEKNIWIPELIFTRFRSGSNFKKKNKTTGGKNGIGSKLTSVFSKRFEIDIINGGKRYYQKVENNCRTINEPVIEYGTDYSEDDNSITITFLPDYDLLGCTLTEDNKKVLYKRVHDMIYLPINICLNNKELPRLTWNEYVNTFKISPKLYTYTNDRWKVAFGITNDKHRNISYVNNISTYDGGEHVKYVIDQIYNQVKNKCDISKNILRSKIVVIVSAIIDDPSFTSQAKEKLSTLPEQFGSTCIIPINTINDFIKYTNIIELLKHTKKTIKTKIKKGRITNVDNLDEANRAGVTEGWKCTLFLCEGLSANKCILTVSRPQGQTTDWTNNGQGTTYYYTGDIPSEELNNWVQFGGFWWRIIRINGDGTIRMIYQGTSANTIGEGTQIGTSAFNSSSEGSYYVGLVHDGSTQHGYGTNSTIMNTLNTWYNDNIENNSKNLHYEQYIDTGAGFCSDRNLQSGSWSATGNHTYAAYGRLINSNNPNLQCSDVDILSKENGRLPYPIGLVTADEAALTGITWNNANTGSYLYTGQNYWTITPYGAASEGWAGVFYVSMNGNLYWYRLFISVGIRPVINLRADVSLSGSGTTSDPFKVVGT